MPSLGVPELLIVLVIIALIFGVGRLGDIGGALGKSISNFKTAVREGADDAEELAEDAAASVTESVSEKAKS